MKTSIQKLKQALCLSVLILIGLTLVPVLPADKVGAEPEFNYAAIRVTLDPDVRNAQITARRVSGDADYHTGGSAPYSDTYSNFLRDGDSYVHNRISIACEGDDSLYVPEFYQFNITATAGNTEYEASSPVTVSCNETSEITLRAIGDDGYGRTGARIKLRRTDCRTGQLVPAPASTRVRLEPLDGQDTPGAPSYRVVGSHGQFSFLDIEPGEYNVTAVWLDNPRDEGQSYEYTFEGTIRVTDGVTTAYPRELIGGPGGDRVCTPPPLEGGEEPTSCESRNSNGLDWLLCGVVNFIDKILIGSNGTGGLLGEVDDLLNISDQYYEDPGLVTAWSYFKNIASLALVLVALVMVIGQAISKE